MIIGHVLIAAIAAVAPTVTDLGALPGAEFSEALDINDFGITVGNSDHLGARHAVRWAANGEITDLGVPTGESSSWATGINNAGTIIGHTTTRALRWGRTGIQLLETPSGYLTTRSSDINDNGVACGEAWSRATLVTRAVRWDADGNATALAPFPGDLWSGTNDLNNAGTVVGWSMAPGGGHHVVRWNRSGTVESLPGLAEANAINDAGVIVGSSNNQPARRDIDGTITFLTALPGAGDGVAIDINRSGEITGLSGGRPARWAPDGSVTDLGTLPQHTNGVGIGINNHGVTAGLSGIGSGGRAVRWTQ